MTRTVLVRALVNDSTKKLKANQFVTVKQVIKDIPEALMVREEAVYLDQGAEYLYLADEMKAQGSGLEVNKNQNPTGTGTQNSEPSNQSPPAPSYTARRVAIKTGVREPGWVEITEGIEAGDNVVYAGLTSIYPGAQLIRVMEDKE